MEEDLLRRAADLAERCERTATVTSTAFLTPAEQYALTNWARHRDCTLVLHGGGEGCERRAAFFLPFYLTAEDFDPAEHLRAVHFSAPFGAPGHRDYLGAILGLGIRRKWVGDILVQDNGAYVFCLPSVAPALLELEQVGRTGVKAAAVELTAVPVPERKVRPVTFTVQSARLDAVVSGMFRLSRTSAAAQIRAGAVHLNYAECLRPDAPVAPGDVLSLRGAGKGAVPEVGGQSRKGRQFVTAELWQRAYKCKNRRTGILARRDIKNLRSLTPEIFVGLSCLTRRSARRPERQRRQPDRQQPSANACKRRRRHTR